MFTVHSFRSTRCGWDLAECLERLTAIAKVPSVLGSIPASSDTVESEGRQMKGYRIRYKQKNKTKNQSASTST